ncbi:hypothetical protein CW311_11510 [Acinetobacter proteolyticus]|uniref:Uncharacterized protein n=1 Tax=Acinetobacter proteolyticus TaxID=1776741 RepID=A0A2N0WEW6_9GAMM|nr:hypothetical protein CW311_11510 [Acinetobacter proteolyticus]
MMMTRTKRKRNRLYVISQDKTIQVVRFVHAQIIEKTLQIQKGVVLMQILISHGKSVCILEKIIICQIVELKF